MAKGNRGGRRGGGGGNAQPVAPTTPTTPVAPNQDLVDYLTRTQTVANSPEMAMARTNPNFDESWKTTEYNENCQRCVWAYELQRRGYDVEALPTYKGDDLPRNGNWKGIIKNHDSWKNEEYVGQRYGQTNSIKTEITNITDAMNNWGDGSRAIVRVAWKNSRSGHVFNIENKNGVIKAYDGQNGKSVNLRECLGRARRGYTSLVRTDNAEINMDEVSRYVKIRGGN